MADTTIATLVIIGTTAFFIIFTIFVGRLKSDSKIHDAIYKDHK